MKKHQSSSSKQTKELASELAKSLKPGKEARLIALSGDLGGGKTTFVQGFLRAMGYKGRVTSPTFVLMKRFGVKKNGFENVFHADAYRLKGAVEINQMGFKEIKANPKNIILLEWPENVGAAVKGAKKIRFEHGETENERKISI